MSVRMTDNVIVNEMAKLHISGNVIPQIWYKTILRDNGKPHLLAITILADIVYWYRPTEIRNPDTGETIGWKQKFRGEYLQRSYSYFEDAFGESKKSIQRALQTLEKIGVISRIVQDVVQVGQKAYGNVLYIKLNISGLSAVTYPDAAPEAADSVAFIKEDNPKPENHADPMDKAVHTYGRDCPDPVDKAVQTYGRECPDPVDKTDQTYTKNNITKISCKNFITKISIFSSSCSESQKEILSVIRNAVEWLSRKSPHDIVAKYSVQEILNHCNMLSDQEIRQVMSYMQSKKVTSKAGIVTALMNADYYLKLAQVSGCGIEENTDKKNRFHCERAYSRAELNDLEKILVCGKEPQTYDDG